MARGATRATSSGTFVAMLRGVNVGGRNRLAMADLRNVASALGFRDVTTYLQSGNVVLTGPGTPGGIARALEDRIALDVGLSLDVVVRSGPQLVGVLDGNPFAKLEDDPTKLHVTFLAGPPEAPRVEEFAGIHGRFGADRLRVVGQSVYLYCPGGYGRTPLNNAFLERRLGVNGTTRNWRTVCALATMAGADAGDRSRPT